MVAWRAAVIIVLALAGCAASPPSEVDERLEGPEGGGADDARLVVDALPWAVGDWWEHEWTFLNGGPAPFTVKSVVAANGTDGYTVATDDLATAVQHAAFFFMDLGTMRDGTMAQGSWRFPWYSFPLAHDATWTATEVNTGAGFVDVTRSLTMRAVQMAQGEQAHFMVEAYDGDSLYARYDYQPSTGWFSTFTVYDEDPSTGEPVPRYTIVDVGHGRGQAGEAYTAVAELALALQTLVHPGSTSPPLAAGQVVTGAGPTHVFALAFSFGAGGAHHVQLAAPDGQHWEATTLADPDGANRIPVGAPGTQVLVGNVPGQWNVALGGGGVLAGGACFLWTVTVTPLQVG